MNTSTTDLSGVMLLNPPQFADARGRFRPVFAQRLHADAGYNHSWAEMNLSHTEPGCIRGLHFQEPHAQAKLITVVSGTIFDVVVDLRPDSPTCGKWASFTLSAGDPAVASQIYIPEGLAHGFATVDGSATIAYLVSTPWNPETEQVLQWDDPTLNIPWPVKSPQLSPRDQKGITLGEIISA